MHILNNEQMQKVDAETIARVCPGIELMERAGRGCAEVIRNHYGEDEGKVVIFAGSGNNGGDGLVIGRYLVASGWKCSVHLLKTLDEMTLDTRKNYQRLNELGDGVLVFECTRPDWIERAEEDVATADVVVDAIFGTGVSGPPRGLALDMIQLINDQIAPVVSVDVPSGIDGSTGETPGEAVIATETLTIGAPKLGSLFHPGRFHCAEVSVVDIGFPEDIVAKHADDLFLLDVAEAAMRLPYRPPDIHKFDAGVLVLVAGSAAYRGAALLSGEAALRSGCGMVYLCVPESVRPQIDVTLREVITVGLPETPAGTIAPDASEVLAQYLARADAVAIGPGMGRDASTDAFIAAFLADLEVPAVVDADAITAFAGHGRDLEKIASPLVLTPHSGELERLLDREMPELAPERIAATAEIADALGVVLVHKGAPTLIAAPGEGIWVNAPGSSALATGGTGDVLTGFVGGLLAQGAEPLDAACTATFLQSRAADLAADHMGKRGVIAGDLLWAVGEVLHDIETMVGE